MDVTQRFLNYVVIDTQSDENSPTCPSTEKQWDLARYLVRELEELGAQNVRLSPYCVVYATIPATTDKPCPSIGFLAHLDTHQAVSGANVHPQRVRYEGQDILLNEKEDIWMRAADFPNLAAHVGEDLIVTDGTTLLGADDKAGIAEIMTMAEYLLRHPELEHGPIHIAFTPDEEIGRGADHFDVAGFGADFAYTLDDETAGVMCYETFNAAAAVVTIDGVSFHPGMSRGRMKNALLMAMEFNGLLPTFENPACTDGYEGFFHLYEFSGEVGQAKMKYLIRDHNADKFQAKKVLIQQAAEYMRQKYGYPAAQVEITDTYYNMKEKITPHPQLIDNARRAIEGEGLPYKVAAIRGGTDGARLSYMGLPCPNLGMGTGNFHSRYEFASVQAMEKMVRVLVNLSCSFARD